VSEVIRDNVWKAESMLFEEPNGWLEKLQEPQLVEPVERIVPVVTGLPVEESKDHRDLIFLVIIVGLAVLLLLVTGLFVAMCCILGSLKRSSRGEDEINSANKGRTSPGHVDNKTRRLNRSNRQIINIACLDKPESEITEVSGSADGNNASENNVSKATNMTSANHPLVAKTVSNVNLPVQG